MFNLKNNYKYDNKFNVISLIVLFLTFFISAFAIYDTHFKTVFILYPIIVGYLIYLRYFKFNFRISFPSILNHLGLLFYFIPIYLLQFLFHYDFSKGALYVISDDIYDYAATSYQLVHYGIENRTSIYSQFYPDLFTGVQPYHYFELWLNGMITAFFGGSYVYNLLFVTYPLLLWLYVLVLLALIEHFKLLKYRYLLLIVCIFVGPLYLGVYERFFNDGNFFDSAVFSIPGFVKQTIVYSYFGQKHLPVYIFSGLFVLGILKTDYRLLFFAFNSLLIASVGVFPGVVSAVFIGFLLLIKRNKKYLRLFIPFILFVIIYLAFFAFFGFGVSKEISTKTSYFNYFLERLNWKGEVFRVIQKMFFPISWFFILYLPYLLLVKLFRIPLSKRFISLIYLVVLSYFGGALLTLILYGLNSDQFITNLLPLYNLVLITLLLYSMRFILVYFQKKSFYLFISILFCFSIVNSYQVFSFHFLPGFKRINKDVYSYHTQKQLLSSLKKHPPTFIAYLFSDSILEQFHSVLQYSYLPAKYCMDNNYFQYVDINYPYYTYPFSSSSNVFSPKNQLKYYFEESPTNKLNFESIQFRFLKEKHINWVFCTSGAIIPSRLKPFVKESISDPISNENYYRIDLR
jgi:hypothetical protein